MNPAEQSAFDEILYDALREHQQHLIPTNSTSVGALGQELTALYDRIRKDVKERIASLIDAAVRQSGMPVTDAIQLMRKAVPDTRLSIEFELNFSSSSEKVELEVSAWNGHDHYHGPTLKAAVELLLLKEGEFEGSPEEADRILREAMEYQEQRL